MTEQIREFTSEDLQRPEGIKELNRQLKALANQGFRVALPYGHDGIFSSDSYLKLVDGLRMNSTTIGYRAPHAGSIISNSVVLGFFSVTSGDATVEIHVNGTNRPELEVEFDTSLGTGIFSDHVVIARHVVSFSAGDLLAAYVNITGVNDPDEVAGIMEIVFDE